MIFSLEFESLLSALVSEGHLSVLGDKRPFFQDKLEHNKLIEWAAKHGELSILEWKILICKIYLALHNKLREGRSNHHQNFDDCQIQNCCHLLLDSSLPVEADHIWPVSLGGPDLEWNLQGLCRVHNRIKGNAFYLHDLKQEEFLIALRMFLVGNQLEILKRQ